MLRGGHVSGVGTAAALLLAGVFAGAGTAKLRRRAATARTFRALRLPAPGALAVAVPAAELGTAVLLVVAPVAGGVAALVALAAFTAVLVAALRRGDTVACGCFGSAGTDAVSAAELVRNALLAVAAAAALTAGPGVIPPAGAVPQLPAVPLPALPAVVLVSTAGVLGLVVIALVRVRVQLGRGLLDASVARGPEGPA